MRCSRCRREAVHIQRYSGLAFCGSHLTEDVEAKARREIRDEGGIRPGDRIAIALSGSPESIALAHFLHRTFGGRRDLSFFALATDGEDRGFSPPADTEAAARSPGLEWLPILQGEGGGIPAGDANREVRTAGESTDPRARAREVAALRAGATVLVLGDCLENLAGQVLAQVMRGEVPEGNRQPALRTLTPFRRIPGEEVRLYGRVLGVVQGNTACRAAGDGPEDLAASLLSDHASRHPSAPHALLRLWDSLRLPDEEPEPRAGEG